MQLNNSVKIKSLLQLFELLPEEQRIITDVLRQIILENLPASCKEKISYNVPFFMATKVSASSGQPLFQGVASKKVCCWDFGMAIN